MEIKLNTSATMYNQLKNPSNKTKKSVFEIKRTLEALKSVQNNPVLLEKVDKI